MSGVSPGWQEFSVVTTACVATLSGLGWVYKQLKRLIDDRFDRIERKLSRTRRTSKKAMRMARSARDIAIQTRRAVIPKEDHAKQGSQA